MVKLADLAVRNVRVSSVAVTVAFIGMGCMSSPSTEHDPVEMVPEFHIPESPAPWSVELNGITCNHPAVDPDCHDGWCRIPAGCFVMGSPEDEPGRGATTEDEVATTLTRSFLIAETEITQKQWNSLIPNNPAGTTLEEEGYPALRSHVGETYPVDDVSWLEALFFANALSASEGRDVCYDLSACQGELGLKERAAGAFACEQVALTTDTVYECAGYRLPTEAEWEYATRSGTRTAYYTGNIGEADEALARTCAEGLDAADAIGWHCGNAQSDTHPAAEKAPNQWGLYDTLGHLDEWVHDEFVSSPGEPPWIDPNGPLSTGPGGSDDRKVKGGSYAFKPIRMRAAASGSFSWDTKANFIGFRLVRTLGSNEEW